MVIKTDYKIDTDSTLVFEFSDTVNVVLTSIHDRANNIKTITSGDRITFKIMNEKISNGQLLIYSIEGKLLDNIEVSNQNFINYYSKISGTYIYQLMYNENQKVSGKFILNP